MAQLGELGRARELLSRATRGFGGRQPIARARCVVALAEVALAMRELGASPKALRVAIDTLDAHGDRANALHARLIALRGLVLVGRVAEAARDLALLELQAAPSLQRAQAALIEAEIALRTLHTQRARAALTRARRYAQRAGVAGLVGEVDALARALHLPAARAIQAGRSQAISLEEVERCLRTRRFVVDACRRSVHARDRQLHLKRRPVLFALVRCLAEAAPAAVTRAHLIAKAFGISRVNESQRVRLRVELARLRKLLLGMAEIRAAADGFALQALLADGAAWSSSALSLALGVSQRGTQRALAALEARAEVHALGRGRARRWVSRPYTEIATVLLLPVAHALGYSQELRHE
jgi:hypothetical protein